MKKLELDGKGKVILEIGDEITTHDGKKLEAVKDIEGNCFNCYFFNTGENCDCMCCEYNEVKLIQKERGDNK